MKFKITRRPVPLLFKQSPIKSYRMWKDALNNLTVLDHAQAKKSGHFWAIFGAVTSSLFLFYQVPQELGFDNMAIKLGIAIFVAALAYLQYCDWRVERQKVNGLIEIKKSMEGM